MKLKRFFVLALSCVTLVNLYAGQQKDGLEFKVDNTALKGGGQNMTCKTMDAVYSGSMQTSTTFYLAQRQPDKKGVSYPLIFSLEARTSLKFDRDQQDRWQQLAKLDAGKGHGGVAKLTLANGEVLSLNCQVSNNTSTSWAEMQYLIVQMLFVLTTSDATSIAPAHEMTQTLRAQDINTIEIEGIVINLPDMAYNTAPMIDGMARFLIQAGSDARVLAKDEEEAQLILSQKKQQDPDLTDMLKSVYGHAVRMHKNDFTYYIVSDNMVRAKHSGICDARGNLIVPMIYDAWPNMPLVKEEDQYIKAYKNGKVVILSMEGTVLLETNYDEVYYYQFKTKEFCEVKNNGKSGLINRKGEEVVPCEFESVWAYKTEETGLVEVTKDGVEGQYSIIEKKMVTP